MDFSSNLGAKPGSSSAHHIEFSNKDYKNNNLCIDTNQKTAVIFELINKGLLQGQITYEWDNKEGKKESKVYDIHDLIKPFDIDINEESVQNLQNIFMNLFSATEANICIDIEKVSDKQILTAIEEDNCDKLLLLLDAYEDKITPEMISHAFSKGSVETFAILTKEVDNLDEATTAIDKQTFNTFSSIEVDKEINLPIIQALSIKKDISSDEKKKLKLLIKNGGNPNIIATQNEKEYLKKTNPKAYDFISKPALYHFVKNKQSDLVKWLVKNNADVNYSATLSNGVKTPLVDCCFDEDNGKTYNSVREFFLLGAKSEYYDTKSLGHYWGLEEKFDYRGKPSTYDSLGVPESNRIMMDYIKKYINKHKLTELEQEVFNESFLINKLYTESSWPQIDQNMEQKLLDDINQGKPVSVKSGWEGHATEVLFYKNFVVKVNRGAGKDIYGVEVYQRGENVTLETINQLHNSKFKNKEESYYKKQINNDLKLILIEENSVELKNQTVGNCGIASKKASIFALLLVLYNFDVEKAKSSYKSFTSFLRFKSLENILENAKNNPETIDWNALTKVSEKVNKKLSKETFFGSQEENFNNCKKLLNQFSDLIAAPIKQNDFYSIFKFCSLNNINLSHLKTEIESNINKENSKGVTPLLEAIRKNDHEIIELLTEKGADINKESSNGATPLIEAITKNNHELIELLIEKGADINKENVNDLSPILAAIRTKDHKIIELLLKNKANINIANSAGITPLIYAVKFEDQNIMKLLIEYGADINKPSSTKKRVTPLHFAAKKKNSDLVKLLLEKGADITIETTTGKTALDIAREENSKEIITLLSNYS